MVGKQQSPVGGLLLLFQFSTKPPKRQMNSAKEKRKRLSRTQRTPLEAPLLPLPQVTHFELCGRWRCRDRCNECGFFVAPVFEDNFFHEETVGSVRVSNTKNVTVAPVNVDRHSHLFFRNRPDSKKENRRKRYQWTTRTFLVLVTIACVVLALTSPENPPARLLQTVTTPAGNEFKIYAVKRKSKFGKSTQPESRCYLLVYGPNEATKVNGYSDIGISSSLGTFCGIHICPEEDIKHLDFFIKTSCCGNFHVLVERSYPYSALTFYDEKNKSINFGISRGFCEPDCNCNRILGSEYHSMQFAWDAAFRNHRQKFQIINCQMQWHGNE